MDNSSDEEKTEKLSQSEETESPQPKPIKKKVRVASRKRSRSRKYSNDLEMAEQPGYATNFFEMDKDEFKQFNPERPTVVGDDGSFLDNTCVVLSKPTNIPDPEMRRS